MKAELNMHSLCRCMMIIKLCRVCVTLVNVTSQSESAVFCPGKRPSLIFDEATTQSFGSAALIFSCQSPLVDRSDLGGLGTAGRPKPNRQAPSCYMCRSD
jgi:hypothetical protein